MKPFFTLTSCLLSCVKGIDDNVRRIFDYLKEAGIPDENAVIGNSNEIFNYYGLQKKYSP